jgi:glycosyltransferase involved in cell wall biosynthesis
MPSTDLRVYLAAPNVSAQMGGEAIKALQIFEELHAALGDVVQIAHARNRQELSAHTLADNVRFLSDDWVDRLLWRSVIFRGLISVWFSYRAVRLAENMASASPDSAVVVIHQTEPNSPVAPRWTSSRFINVFGPINGNIYYPRDFRKFESISAKLRRILHFPFQYINKLNPRGISNANLVLAAGGARTTRSLRAAGVPQSVICESLDCGVPDALLEIKRIVQPGSSGRFVQFGRLVFHKGTWLAIEAVARSNGKISLDIVGRGPELERCKALARSLGVEDRVRFLDWYRSREELVASFGNYTGMILPSIEDANGIVVQEAMSAGLIPVCLNWGGPQLLIEHGVSGYLIEPEPLEGIAPAIAVCLMRLEADEELARAMSSSARARAAQWGWKGLIREWIEKYRSITPNVRQ